MGLTVRAKGLTDETSFDCGYITFGAYRMNVAQQFGAEFGTLYERWYGSTFTKISEDEVNRLNELLQEIPEGAAAFLVCSDCDGKFTPKECGMIYDALEPLKIDMQGHNYGVMKPYNMHEHWLNMFRHCAKKRVNMYFS